jgi:hypothetical protein
MQENQITITVRGTPEECAAQLQRLFFGDAPNAVKKARRRARYKEETALQREAEASDARA